MAVILLIGVMLLSVYMNVRHVYDTIDTVSEKTNEAVLAVAAANVAETYGGTREGVGTARRHMGGSWGNFVSTTEVINSLQRMTNSTRQNNDLTAASYTLANISTRYVNIQNGNLNFITTVTVKIPISVGVPVPPIETVLEVHTTYEPKF